MKKLISGGIFVFAFAVVALFSSSFASAQTTTTTPTTPTPAQIARCTLAQTRLTTLFTKVEASQKAQTAIFNGVSTKLDTYVDSAKANGFDTTALVKAQTDTKTKLTTYTEKATAYTAALTAAKAINCQTAEATFAPSIVTVRAALLATRLASLDAKKTYKESVVPALKAYAAWLTEQAKVTE